MLSAPPERAVDLVEALGRGGDAPMSTLRALATVVGRVGVTTRFAARFAQPALAAVQMPLSPGGFDASSSSV